MSSPSLPPAPGMGWSRQTTDYILQTPPTHIRVDDEQGETTAAKQTAAKSEEKAREHIQVKHISRDYSCFTFSFISMIRARHIGIHVYDV